MGLPTPYSFTDPLNPTPNPAHESDEARVAFWEKQAQRLTWAEPWHTAHRFEKPKSLGFDEEGIEQFTVPEIKWFEGGKLNVAYNCVDRHVEAGRGDKVALYFEGEPGDREAITYAELQRRIAKAANGLLSLGVRKGPCGHLPARHSRNHYLHPGLRAYWSDSLPRVRRFLRRGAEVPC